MTPAGVSMGSREDHTRRVLRERARALARPPEEAQEDMLLAVSFVLGGVTLAVAAEHVRELWVNPQLARLGAAGGLLDGLVNVRGEIVAVADIRSLLGLPAAPAAAAAMVLLEGAAPLGLLVDEIGDLISLTAGSLAPPPPDSTAAGLVAAVGDQVILLDADALLNDRRLYATNDGSMNGLD